MINNFADLEKYLESLTMFGIKLGLEQTRELFDRAGAPLCNGYIHIAGTNGKGSSGAMLEAALRRCGLKTGFYTSPHLVSVRERFRIDGRAVSEEMLSHYASMLWAHADAMRAAGRGVTYFEFTTALAALLFAGEKTDYILWETGMGGRCDATNVVTPEMSLITGISLDHQQYLGDTIGKIAGEKAGIVKHDRPVFTGVMPQEALEVIRQRAAAVQAPCPEPCDYKFSDVRYERTENGIIQHFNSVLGPLELSLIGPMQRRNLQGVLPCLEYLASKNVLSLPTALAGLGVTRWPGRCQELSHRLIIDGGHNPDGAAALVEAMRELDGDEKFTVIFAGFKDKDVAGNLRILSELAAEFIFTPLAETRPSYSGEELCSMIHGGIKTRAARNPAEALRMAYELPCRVLAVGSLYLVGEILRETAPGAALDLI